MSNCKYKLRKLSVGLVSVGTMFTATTVMGSEVTTPTATTTEPTVSTVSDSSSPASASTVTSELSENSGASTVEQPKTESQLPSVQVEKEEASETTASNSEESSSPKASPRSRRSAETESEPQLMEVENFTVDNEKSELHIKDGERNQKLIKNRDEKQREIVEVSRDVKVNDDSTVDVTLTVKPKQIDEGAEVIVLLDTSKKMSEGDFNTAKDNIKKLVTTLTNTDSTSNYNSRNSVRLISFYRKVNDPISLTVENVESKLDEVWNNAKADWNWGVDLQGAIHKAREIFNNEKKSGKRQHIILFSQGEATLSYDIKEKDNLLKTTVKEPVTSSNPLLPWPFYFDSTTNTANLVKDGEKIKVFLQKLGIKRYEDLLDGLASKGNTILELGSDLLGTNNPLDYITLSDLDTKNLTEEKFDYSKTLGEGYNFRSYYTRESSEVPLKSIVREAVKQKIKKLKEQAEKNSGWLDVLGITKWSNSISKALGFDQVEEQMINKVIDNLFYKRNYVYYNHNLSAQAEAKMARDEGIIFYSFDVTNPSKFAKAAVFNPNYPTYAKYLMEKDEKAKKIIEERNKKFDKYLKDMSDGKDFLKNIDDKDKFKDVLEEVTVTETFEDKVTVANQWKNTSQYKDSNGDKQAVKHTPSSTWLLGTTNESLTWTISKEQMQKAFESGTPLTLTYKLDVNNAKFKASLDKRRKKRSTSTDTNDSLTEKIISNKISYQINKKSANSQKLDDVKLTYTKVKVPVPEIEGEVIEPLAPQSPEKPLVEPMMPLYPAIPIAPETPNNDDLEISGGSSEIDIVEDTGSGIESGSANGVISIQENTDPIVEITEDTQPGMSGHSNDTTIIEDTKPEKTDTIIGSNVIDFTEDSITHNQYTESGHNSTNESQEIIEDTKPETSDTIIGGQSDPIDITEDTQSGMSGHSNDTTIFEDTKQPEVIMGGQANIVDMVENTQPGMSGFNEATVIEEDTRPKLQFHFENEEPIPAINKATSQTPIAKVENKLPQTGDKEKLEAFFTITALAVIGGAGLLSKKDRKKRIN